MGKMGIPGSISVNLSDGRSGMETSGRRMAGSGKQYPASVVGILWGDTGRKTPLLSGERGELLLIVILHCFSGVWKQRWYEKGGQGFW